MNSKLQEMSSEPSKNKALTTEEARQLSLKILHESEEQRKKSYEAEALFDQRRAFGEFGEAALLFMIDKGCSDCETGLVDEDFKAKYGVSKRDVNFALICFQIALENKDFVQRNEYYDVFIKLFSKV
jgi:hypothetical protein